MYSTAIPSISHRPPPYLPSPTLSTWGLRNRGLLPPISQKYTQERAREAALPKSGLRTPPYDDMGTTYQVPNLASYENHNFHHSAYASTLAPAERSRTTNSNEPTTYASSRSSSIAQQSSHPPQGLPHHRPTTTTTTNSSLAGSRQSTRPSTPSSSNPNTMAGQDKGLSERDQAMVHHNLNIPKCISPRGGSLVDFAAHITAMLWFESVKVIEAAEKIQSLSPTAKVPLLNETAVASPHFKKWVYSVLSTTQVTQNVILLALMFVYRLKKTNPTVHGRPGSEYRLLTVALMLGNKFLDDNTYTNKTWADVSGIGVTEIHVMEVEFLSNMRYSLLASKEQWEEWLVKLAGLWEYIERAQRSAASPPPMQVPSPTHRFASPLPSPTHSGTLGYLTPSLGAAPSSANLPGSSPLSATYASNNGQVWPTPYHASAANSAISPLAVKPELQSRKRGFPEEDPIEAPAKRANLGRQSYPLTTTMSQAQTQPPAVSQPVPQQPARLQAVPQHAHSAQHQAVAHLTRPAAVAAPKPVPSQARLSVPNLTINTAQPTVSQPPAQYSHSSSNSYAPQQASALSLPPLVPGVRAMSTVYPPPTSYASHVPIMPTTGPSNSSVTAPVVTPTTNYPPMSYGTPTKRLSPQHALTPAAPFTTSSPITDAYPHHAPIGVGGTVSGVHTPISHSPSVYLQQRQSPYKPVRNVNTLLYPPSSAFLQQYHLASSVPPTHMHYQPLGRRHEVRTGVVPEFVMASQGQYGVPPGGQHHAVTPARAQPVQHLLQGQDHHQGNHHYVAGPGRHVPAHYPPN